MPVLRLEGAMRNGEQGLLYTHTHTHTQKKMCKKDYQTKDLGCLERENMKSAVCEWRWCVLRVCVFVPYDWNGVVPSACTLFGFGSVLCVEVCIAAVEVHEVDLGCTRAHRCEENLERERGGGGGTVNLALKWRHTVYFYTRLFPLPEVIFELPSLALSSTNHQTGFKSSCVPCQYLWLLKDLSNVFNIASKLLALKMQ